MIDSQIKKDGVLTVKLSGRLDSLNAPETEQAVRADFAGITQLILDLSSLEYISSAGLRTILVWQKHMDAVGAMVVCHVTPDVQEIFELTGFSDFLDIR